MKNFKITRGVFFGLVIALCPLVLDGCKNGRTKLPEAAGNGSISEGENASENGSTFGNDSPSADDAGSYDANSLIDSSAMQGSVITFEENGCTVNQQMSADGGKSARIASPGSENSDTEVNIQYNQDCIFQSAKINTTTEMAAIKDATISDIKKQTKLIIYGVFQDTHNLVASKVIITSYE